MEFGRRTSGDLLGAELTELGFQVLELFFEVVFALAPELAGADLWSGLHASLAMSQHREIQPAYHTDSSVLIVESHGGVVDVEHQDCAAETSWLP